MTTTNAKVVDAFFNSAPGRSHGKNFHTQGEYLYSYDTPIARLLEDGTVLVRSQDECDSPTTSAHANKVFLEAVRRGQFGVSPGARVRWEQLKAWGLSPEDVTSAKEDHAGGITLSIHSEYWLYHPNREGAPFVNSLLRGGAHHTAVHLGTWYKVDRAPVSPLHFVRTFIGEDGWRACLEHRVVCLGDLYFIEMGDGNNSPSPYSELLYLPQGYWKVACKQVRDRIRGPFSLRNSSNLEIPLVGNNDGKYEILPIDNHRHAPLDSPVAAHPTLTLMEW